MIAQANEYSNYVLMDIIVSKWATVQKIASAKCSNAIIVNVRRLIRSEFQIGRFSMWELTSAPFNF